VAGEDDVVPRAPNPNLNGAMRRRDRNELVRSVLTEVGDTGMCGFVHAWHHGGHRRR
jgi:hypothetical protein